MKKCGKGISRNSRVSFTKMKIIILAHGKIKKGPELELISDYVTRFNRQFNNDFLTSLEISESTDFEGIFNTKVAKMLDDKDGTAGKF